ncbi:MAG: alpha/beta hydrolase [Woeseiaceae bacterium]
MRLAALIAALFSLSTQVNAQNSYFTDNDPEVVRYQVETDLPYGQGKVLRDGKEDTLELTMDAYYPLEQADSPRPAIILVYGGAHHRGNPRVKYVGFGSQTTSMSEYAMRFSEEGIVAFTIRYRVAPDNPVVGPYEGFSEDDLETDFLLDPAAISQANIIRGQMGLEPLTMDTSVPVLKSAIIAGAEDLRAAIQHIKRSSEEFDIDPDRIALMGFSAGAVTAINVAFGMQEEVAAVIANSGYPSVFNMQKLVTAESDVPPVLMFMAQNDYAVVEMELPPFIEHLSGVGAEYSLNWIPSHGHFYPSGTTSLGSDGSRMSVEARSIQFLNEVLNDRE